MGRPAWLYLHEELMPSIVREYQRRLGPLNTGDLTLDMIPECSLQHWLECYEVTQDINLAGKHAVALCLLRQSVESSTIIELGLVDLSIAKNLLNAWHEGNTQVGKIRAQLEKTVWRSYGTGLWDESWAEFFGNLAKAVHPYAHYSPGLMGWRIHTVRREEDKSLYATMGYSQYDALKASRVTILWSIAGYTLARLLLATEKNEWALRHETHVRAWGRALGQSSMLFAGGEWPLQFMPHMLFNPDVERLHD